jgi:hypothetical protein
VQEIGHWNVFCSHCWVLWVGKLVGIGHVNCLVGLVLDGWLSAGNWVLTCMCDCVSLSLDVGGLGGRNWAHKRMSVFLLSLSGLRM